jgi:hypothetical protein
MTSDRSIVAAGSAPGHRCLALAKVGDEGSHGVVVGMHLRAGGIEPAPEDGHGPDDRSEPLARIARRREVLTARRIGSLAATFVVALLLVACGHELPGVQPAPSRASNGPLVIVETRGGECPAGPCGSTIVIEADGRVRTTTPAPVELRLLQDNLLDALKTEIGQADFVRLKSQPFTGTCPTAYDGQEMVYTFSTLSGTERIASCEFEVDPANPLFAVVAAALLSVGRP